MVPMEAAQVPVWVTIVVAVITAVGGFVANALTGWVDWRKGKDANVLEQSKSDRATLMQAIEIIRSKDSTQDGIDAAHAVVWGMSRMGGLSEANAELVRSVTSTFTDPALEAGRKVIEAGEDLDYVVEEGE